MAHAYDRGRDIRRPNRFAIQGRLSPRRHWYPAEPFNRSISSSQGAAEIALAVGATMGGDFANGTLEATIVLQL